jgi:lon-related putative ATP-dependent protease
MLNRYELEPSQLRAECDPKVFPFKDTREVEPLYGVIGQKRAVQAIHFGLNMKCSGYHIFITGMPGTGKTTIVQDLVRQHSKNLRTPDDLCMVNNFSDEYQPKTISVASGMGKRFCKRVSKLIDDIRKELPEIFTSENFQAKQSKIKSKYSKIRKDIIDRLEQKALAKNIQISKTSSGFHSEPLVDGKPISPEEFQYLPKQQQEQFERDMQKIQEEMESAFQDTNKIFQAYRSEMEKLSRETALEVLQEHFVMFRDEYRGRSGVLSYLEALQSDLLENINNFIPSGKEQESDKEFFKRYGVNVLVNNTGIKGAPVIFEPNPTYHNMFGLIEKRAVMGSVMTGFRMVQAGSLLRANGGYLILEIDAVLMNNYVWESLKRALQNKLLYIEDVPSGSGNMVVSLKPEPIPVDVKVILLGSYEIFHKLQNYDVKFNKIFNVRADFDYEVERNHETVQQYAGFIARTCKEENLLPFTAKGVSAIVEFGEKFVSHQHKMTLRLGYVAGILKEADYWARKGDSLVVEEEHVIKAFMEHRFRYNFYEEKIHESYTENMILVDVEGEVAGQVNALVVYQIGDYSFGRPSRITAETFMGKEGIINIEREVKLSGNTHDKGVMILSGYLGRTFAQNYPLSLSISITFEQSYGPVDGDSASSSELYAVISSLSGIPINQGIAVTGSVNQKGRIQAIGGINQKIEGFFEVCQMKGLTGKQGVMIPSANLKNLMLKKEVIRAVQERKFHIYQVSTVEEGIQILTGVPAGIPDMEGRFSTETVFGKVQEKLEKYFRQAQKYRKELDFYGKNRN